MKSVVFRSFEEFGVKPFLLFAHIRVGGKNAAVDMERKY